MEVDGGDSAVAAGEVVLDKARLGRYSQAEETEEEGDDQGNEHLEPSLDGLGSPNWPQECLKVIKEWRAVLVIDLNESGCERT